MDISLISPDRELYSLCAEVVEELFGRNVNFHSSAITGSDIYVWDFSSGMKFPENLDGHEKRKHLFLVARKQLAAFHKTAPAPDVNVLLKPVTRATLRAFLTQANSIDAAPESSRRPTLGSIRAERDEVLQCLIQANLKLQEYDQERTNFLARAVHDFRAPLTALSGYCGLLLGGLLGSLEDEQKEVLRRMQYSAKRLTRMAEAMFQLSIDRRVNNALNLQRNDIRETVDQALQELMPFADEKRISVSLELEAATGPLFYESSQIEQVLVNLLDNACKFTPKSGFVQISGYPFFWDRRRHNLNGAAGLSDRRVAPRNTPNSFRLDIRDSGPGIPAEHLEKIFEEYTSYSGGHDRSGGGLGLAICKLILNRHHGRIWAESSSEGAVFSVVLPFHVTDAPPANNHHVFDSRLAEV